LDHTFAQFLISPRLPSQTSQFIHIGSGVAREPSVATVPKAGSEKEIHESKNKILRPKIFKIIEPNKEGNLIHIFF
jgi:hypothetical protein